MVGLTPELSSWPRFPLFWVMAHWHGCFHPCRAHYRAWRALEWMNKWMNDYMNEQINNVLSECECAFWRLAFENRVLSEKQEYLKLSKGILKSSKQDHFTICLKFKREIDTIAFYLHWSSVLLATGVMAEKIEADIFKSILISDIWC